MTDEERQANYSNRLQALQEAIEALPANAQEFVRRYRRHVELVGRSGPTGCALPEMELFVRDVTLLVERPAGEFTNGSGV